MCVQQHGMLLPASEAGVGCCAVFTPARSHHPYLTDGPPAVACSGVPPDAWHSHMGHAGTCLADAY
jgi:hypothetical protein